MHITFLMKRILRWIEWKITWPDGQTPDNCANNMLWYFYDARYHPLYKPSMTTYLEKYGYIQTTVKGGNVIAPHGLARLMRSHNTTVMVKEMADILRMSDLL